MTRGDENDVHSPEIAGTSAKGNRRVRWRGETDEIRDPGLPGKSRRNLISSHTRGEGSCTATVEEAARCSHRAGTARQAGRSVLELQVKRGRAGLGSEGSDAGGGL